MRAREKIGTGTFSPLGGEAAAVLGGAVVVPRWCIGGYTLIDGYLYPDYIEDAPETAVA